MPQAARRLWELDALRGLLLVLMTLTHMPTRFSLPLGQPFGFVSAAEGFVFLSAFMAGRVYGTRGRRQGVAAMQAAFFARAWKLYLCHMALVTLAFTVIAWLGVRNQQGGATGLLEFYFIDRGNAVLGAMLLLHNPPLLDILPLYVGLMLLSPVVLGLAARFGWQPVLLVSALLWLAEQWGLGRWVYGLWTSTAQWPVPYKDMGAFHGLAWQGLWVAGLALGMRQTPLPRWPWWVLGPAAAYALGMLVWRHVAGQAPLPGWPAVAFLLDKWALGPARVLNFASLFVVLTALAPWIHRHLPRPWPLELMGRHSLLVFCSHLVLALFTLATFGSTQVWRPYWLDALLLAGSLVALLLVAWLAEWRDRGVVRPWRMASGGAQVR